MSISVDFDDLAAQIHGFYARQWPEHLPPRFDQLPEFLKEDNRAAARRIGQVLSMAGLRLEPRNESKWTAEEQNEIRQAIEENIDLLAEAEHNGWVAARLRQGWERGTHRDLASRISHLLVPYHQLYQQVAGKHAAAGPAKRSDGAAMTVEEEVQDNIEKDRNSVRSYVAIIGNTEYRIVREH